MVEALSEWRAQKVVCSKESCIALMENGDMYSWGSAKHGILGIDDESENQFFPIKLL